MFIVVLVTYSDKCNKKFITKYFYRHMKRKIQLEKVAEKTNAKYRKQFTKMMLALRESTFVSKNVILVIFVLGRAIAKNIKVRIFVEKTKIKYKFEC